ncbi:hypothetical protein Lesp02_12190 [Lentzea sp. NBRC 105346]|uniref:hypothetical protein n=1 Tax=Lentzea sp. NBRC 105346 TaxID=3032205 RepID=UPI0024A226C3|nr:hypothetical protein [Lentzea sp. NBRC 105346]GLZ29029.1 hypothetical protein Lesp02_12190 [Lentzea sp. NBRC 105346]
MNDEELLDRLRAIASEVDGVPELVHEEALAALETRRMGERLAELIADSLQDLNESVRAAEQIRSLTFEAGEVSIEVQLDDTLRGLVTGASGTITIETPGGSTTVRLDESGWFTFTGDIRTARLRVRTDDGTEVVTGWFTN